MNFNRKASVQWKGDKKGKGTITTDSGALKNVGYTFGQRFDNDPGTNPEELIAAAHAACFSMAFTAQLEAAGHTAERVNVTASVKLVKQDKGWGVTKIHLDVNATVPDLSNDEFNKIAEDAKNGCPISRLLKPGAEITMEAKLGQTATTSMK